MKNNLLLLFLFLSVLLNAQKKHYAWHNFSTNDGLPSPEVYTVIQDSKGFLWFGTDNGVSRYDGYTFRNFGAKEGLMDNVVNGIQEDAAGRIWFSAMWGKLYYFENDTIHAFKYNSIIESYQKLFFMSAGFYRFKKGEKGIDSTPEEDGVFIGLTNLGILKILDNGQSELFTAPKAPAILVFNGHKKNISVQQILENGVPHKKNPLILNIHQFDGQKLIYRGLAHLTPVNDMASNTRWKTNGVTSFLFTSKSIHRQIGNGSIYDTPYNTPIYDIITDEDGQIWTAEGNNGGLKCFQNIDAIGKSVSKILIKNMSSSSILRDRDGGYWVTTIDKGVFYLRNKKVQIFDAENGHLPLDDVYQVIYWDKNSVFINLGNREVGLYDTQTKAYKTIDRFPLGDIIDMKWQPKTQKLYIATSSQIHIWQQGQITKIEKILPKKIALNANKDRLWVIGYRNLIEIVGSKIQNHLQFVKINVQSRIFSFFEDRQHRVWISKLDGLYRLENDSLVAASLLHHALKIRVEDIAELPNGSLVFATKGKGLVIYDGKTALNLTKEEGLVTDMIENIATDAKGNIWVGTLAGMNKLSPKPDGKGWNIQPITMFHGLPSNEINGIAINTEGVFLATPKGLVFYKDKAVEVPNPAPFLSYFKAASTFKDLSKTRIFNARENDIEIAWHCINFHIPNKILYRYRLNPKEEWRYTYNQNVQFPSLMDGDYAFEVQAQNENSVWSDALKLPFTVLPYWFETVWFRALIIFLVGLGVYLFYKSRINRLKAENATLQHINDLERSALATQMNPHFIFNCLNSIQLLIQRGLKNEAMTYLSRFAKMVRFTLESTRRGKVTIDEEVEALTNYLTLEKLRFKEALEFTIKLDASVDGFSTEIPAMLIQPFVENALKHGFDSSEKAAKITVYFAAKNDFLYVEVQDNGCGFDHKAVLNSVQNAQSGEDTYRSSRYNREGVEKREKTGVGIGLSRQRLALHNGQNAANDLLIESILGDTDQVLGTSVRLKIRML